MKKQQKQMTVSEVARLTGYSTKRVDQLARAGVLTPQKVAGFRIYTDADLTTLLAWRARVQSRHLESAPEQD